MKIKIVADTQSELEQAAIILCMPREQIAELYLAPGALSGHTIEDSDIDDFLRAVGDRALELAEKAGYIARVP